MKDQTNILSRRNGMAVVVLGIVGCLLVAGCSFNGFGSGFGDSVSKVFNGSSKPVPAPQVEQVAAVVPPPPPIEPALHTAGDSQMTVFGELPNQSRVPFQARSMSPMQQHTDTVEGADFDIDISPDGKWLVFSSTRHTAQPNIYLKSVDGVATTQLTSDPAADVQPCFSPDGKWVIFASHRSGNWDLWMIGLQGGQATQITHSPLHEIHPSFAPDGRRVVYSLFNERAEQWELWTLRVFEPGSRRMIGYGIFPEWSPAADSIVYQKARERGGRWFSVWRVDLVNGEPSYPVEIASSSQMAYVQPSWSPDGQWITYGTAKLDTDAGYVTGRRPIMTQGDIWVVQRDGTSPIQLTDGGGAHFGSVWSSDSRVYFTSQQNGTENVWSARPALIGVTQNTAPMSDNAAASANVPTFTTIPNSSASVNNSGG